MDNMKTNGSSVVPYVILGSVVGGAVGYLMVSESGKKIRHALTHPNDLATNVEQAGSFLERKASMLSDRVHSLLDSAKRSIEEGQVAYREVGQRYRTQIRQIQSKNNDVAGTVHQAVDRMSNTAAHVEERVLDPVAELGAIFRGVERGIRSLFGKSNEPTNSEPIPIYRDNRLMGS